MSRRATRPPSGVGLYLRGEGSPGLYPHGREATVAAIGPRWVVALHKATTDAELLRYKAAGRLVFLWAGPRAWEPDAWRRTRLELSGRAQRLGLRGYVADIEDDDHTTSTRPWAGRAGELRALLAAIAADGARMSVGLSSFPSHPVWRLAAPHKGRIWVNPQLYGVRTPGSAAERAQSLAWFDETFGAAVPAVAGWAREGDVFQGYLSEWKSRRSVVIWTATVSRQRIAELAAFNLGPPMLAAGGAGAVLALVVLVVGFRGLS